MENYVAQFWSIFSHNMNAAIVGAILGVIVVSLLLLSKGRGNNRNSVSF